MSLFTSLSWPALKYIGYHYKVLKIAFVLIKYILFTNEYLSALFSMSLTLLSFRGLTVPESKIYQIPSTWITSPVGKQNNPPIIYKAWHQKEKMDFWFG